MSYFNNPKDVYDLEKQCKQALIKYNYKTNEAARIAIMKEYQALKRRLVVEDVTKGVNELVDERKAKIRTEEQRVAQLKNAGYSDEKIRELINECKKYIDQILHRCAETKTDYYMSWHDKMFNYDSENVCRMFNRLHRGMGSKELGNLYDQKREVLEYAVKSRAKTASEKEQAMVKMEKLLGKYISDRYSFYEDEFGDAFEIAKKMSVKDKEKRYNNFTDKLLTVASWLILGYSIISCATTFRSKDGILLGLVVGIALFVLLRLFRGFVRLVNRKLGGKNLGDTGFARKRSRISEQDEYRRGKVGKTFLNFLK